MSAYTQPVRCARQYCQICNTSDRLINDGAEMIRIEDLVEQECQLYLAQTNAYHCIWALCLDRQKANYRIISTGKTTMMCDFAVLAEVNDTAHIVAIELKSGNTRISSAVEQLKEGLSVLHRYFQTDGLPPAPRALLVAGIDSEKNPRSARLRRATEGRGGRLKFGSEEVQIEVMRCGNTLSLGS